MEKNCCTKNIYKKQGKGVLKGFLYGIFPHSFCIAFIFFSTIGAVTITTVLKKIMVTPYFLHLLFLLSIIMATISAIIYLKKCDCLDRQGISSKKKYLLILFGTTIFINFLMFSYVIPIMASINSFKTNNVLVNISELSLRVDIPCEGHAPLIIDELKKCKGVEAVKFESPNVFKIKYDFSQISPKEITEVEILKIYKAQIN